MWFALFSGVIYPTRSSSLSPGAHDAIRPSSDGARFVCLRLAYQKSSSADFTL